jgi:hypothetical protein
VVSFPKKTAELLQSRLPQNLEHFVSVFSHETGTLPKSCKRLQFLQNGWQQTNFLQRRMPAGWK